MKANEPGRAASSDRVIGRGLQYASTVLFLSAILGAVVFNRLKPDLRDLDDGDYRGYWASMIVNFAILAAGLIFVVGTYCKSKGKETDGETTT